MKILGINQVPGILAWMHDAAAAVVVDGKIVATAEEERFNRQRHARGNPKKAMEYCLREAGLTLKDIDIIAIAHNPFAPLRLSTFSFYPPNLARDLANLFIFLWHARQLSRAAGGAKVVFVDHHLAHAASAYFCSGFPRANILTIDGSGETESFAYFLGEGDIIRRVWDIPLGSRFAKKKWASIGMVYTAVTTLLNLGTHAEGKTMGLASYGKPAYDFSSILSVRSHKDYTIDRRQVRARYGHLARKEGAPLSQEHKNLAASLQRALEDAVVHLACEAHQHSGSKRFCFAGGVALNCNANSRVLQEDFCDKLFIQPAAHDGGIALGAALYAAARAGDRPMARLAHAYWGPAFSDEEIETLLKESKLPYERSDNIARDAARLVAQGNIVGWFQGRMEMGPRALGNRSILANPMVKGMDERVNREVKHREPWRPFAPSVTEEDASRYFEGVEKAKESPFMLHTFYVKKEYREVFPAITHVDGSSRIQTVREDQNPRYYRFLKELETLTGHPVVMNTSFNDKGEPIVCTPKDALKCYAATGFDALAIGNFLLTKPSCNCDAR